MTHYSVSAHPCGGIQFAGCDENGKEFSLRLNEWAFMVAGDEAATSGFRRMAHNPQVDTRAPFDNSETLRGVERT